MHILHYINDITLPQTEEMRRASEIRRMQGHNKFEPHQADIDGMNGLNSSPKYVKCLKNRLLMLTFSYNCFWDNGCVKLYQQLRKKNIGTKNQCVQVALLV